MRKTKFEDAVMKKIIHRVSLNTYTEKEIIEEIISSFYYGINKKMKDVVIEDPDSFPIVGIPNLGKLIIKKNKIKHMNEVKSKNGNSKDESIQ